MPRKDSAAPVSAQAQQDAVSEGIENFELPRALVMKIAKSAVPDNTKLQKDTVLSLVKGATVFINYLAATAHDVSTSKQHKSISASDVLKALEQIEFADLVGPLQTELQIYRDNLKGRRGTGTSVILPAGSASAPPNAGAAKGKAAARGKGKERAADETTSAPLPPGYPNGAVHEPTEDADEEMLDAAAEEDVGPVEGLDGEVEDEEDVEEDVDDEQEDGDVVGDEEDAVAEPVNGVEPDVEMGGLREDDVAGDADDD
ncbi:histone-fold-containing protein [Auriscalpium vulgare]|uniref:Histone-fold-containing protein n=1 Tax=Auriscalpium vulgare TaxID=40419 RepID=A0ACB8S209_9AGAM|nr:histone-fold-containing protein [Auriscalpium vulgare]